MKKNLNLLILGGDIRQIEVAKMAAAKGTKVSLVGFDQFSDNRLNSMKCGMKDVDVSVLDAILLPVSGVNEDGTVHSSFSDEEIALSQDDISRTPQHCVIYTGIKTPYLNQLVRFTNRKLVPLFERDDLAIYNSIPTAEGTLKIAIENTDFMIHGSKVAVLGYGRVGKTVARVFSAVGANVHVGANRTSDLARITEVGLTSFHLRNLENEVSDVDICINTIPDLILNPSVLSKMSLNSLIIDLASKPGGTDFKFAEENGLNVVWALGLPGKVAPKSAGEILGKVFVEVLEEDFKERFTI